MWRFPWAHLLGERWGMQFCRMVVNRLARESKREKEDFELGGTREDNKYLSASLHALPVIVSGYYWSDLLVDVVVHLCLSWIISVCAVPLFLNLQAQVVLRFACLTPFALFVCICRSNAIAMSYFYMQDWGHKTRSCADCKAKNSSEAPRGLA